MKVMHVVNELTIGGGAVHIHQLLKDTLALGHEAACATFESGPVASWMRDDNIPVFYMKDEQDLHRVIEHWGPHVLHGHTCGGGAFCCPIAREYEIVGGETIHSMVPGTNCDASFEVVEVVGLHKMRPRSTLIPWAFNPQRFQVKRSREEMSLIWNIPPGVPIIGRNGRLDGSKAPDDFVRTLSRLPGAYGVLVGGGVEADNLKRLSEELGCADRLRMPGFQTELGDFFNMMDVIVYPTHDESVCAGVHEPLFLQKPVVCYPRGGMAETIIHRKTGLHASNVDELVHWTVYCLANPDAAKALGQAGWRMIQQKHQDNPLLEAQRHLELYQSLR